MTKVTLRKRKLISGKISLYLDFYPTVLNVRTGKHTRHEYLGLYLYPNPENDEQRLANDETYAIAMQVRDRRCEDIARRKYGLEKGIRPKVYDFIDYFSERCRGRSQSFYASLRLFKEFTGGSCGFEEITLTLCEKFRQYLLESETRNGHPISRNTASSYFSSFTYILKIAYNNKLIDANLHDCLTPIRKEEVQKGYLTDKELEQLFTTPCDNELLVRFTAFAYLTGWRLNEIMKLSWRDFEYDKEGNVYAILHSSKTGVVRRQPVSKNAYSVCGPKSVGLVFKGFKREMAYAPLQKWLKDAGITKHITMHSFRHSFATALTEREINIYTVSKLLSHKSIQSTQVYAGMSDKLKREAVEKLKIPGLSQKAGLLSWIKNKFK